MKVQTYLSQQDQDKVHVPEEAKWFHDVMEPRDKQLTRLTQVLQSKLTFPDNMNAYAAEFSAAHNTEYVVSTGTLGGSAWGVIPIYNEFWDHCQIAWEPHSAGWIKVTPFFRTAPSGEAKLRILILGT